MDVLLDLTTWASLVTLVILEIILGIDNIIFISLLSEKLPEKQKTQARGIGLLLALCIRFIILIGFLWVTKLNHPIIKTQFFTFSSRDLILFLGGFFLLFKAIIELHEKLDNPNTLQKKNKSYPNFWVIVLQMIILDSVFSIDSIITAIGMVENLYIMFLSIIIASISMFFLSNILTKLIRLHKSVIVLCLSFLLIIGFSLIAESIGFKIPQVYLYVIIIFSIFIEFLNQIAKKNFIKQQFKKSIRERAVTAITQLIMKTEEINAIQKAKKKKLGKNIENDLENDLIENTLTSSANEKFEEEEKYMINNVLKLGNRTIRSIMTPRNEISWINMQHEKKKIRTQLLDTPHNLFPVCIGELDEIIGVVRAKELVAILDENCDVKKFSEKTPPIIIPDTLDSIKLLGVLRRAKGSLVLVSNEFGIIQGLITPVDVLEAIAGEFPDEDETPEIIHEKNSWLVKGTTDLHTLENVLNTKKLIKNENYTSLAGLLISQKGQFPVQGDTIKISSFLFHILEATKYIIYLVRITKEKKN